LEKLELIVDDKPTWGCFLLFKKNSSALPHSIIRVARIKGTSKIIDDNFIEGALVTLVEPAMNAITKNLRVEYVIKDKPGRDEILEYPFEAMREALLNAICHRDYTDNSDILIKIYDDHLSIWNPGQLPYNLSIAQLLRNEHSSKPRNKLITQAFYDMGDIERLGSGIQRILDSCKEAGLPAPEIKEEEGGFHVIFKRPTENIYTDKHVPTEGGAELVTREEKVIAFVMRQGKITNSDYQKLFKVSRRTATRELTDLVEKKVLEKSGVTGKGTAYLKAKSKRL
jgi:ATP-dependent DNA helicase RecG